MKSFRQHINVYEVNLVKKVARTYNIGNELAIKLLQYAANKNINILKIQQNLTILKPYLRLIEEIKVESVLKLGLTGSVLSTAQKMQKKINDPDSILLMGKDLHITLASGPEWKKIRTRIQLPIPEPDFRIDLEDPIKITKGNRTSWYSKIKQQKDISNYVQKICECLPNPKRVYHVSLANLTGRVGDSVALVEDYIVEAQAMFNTNSMIFVNYQSPALILSPTMIDRVFGDEKVKAWHVTDLRGLIGLKRIEGKKSSISVFTELQQDMNKIFQGVETGGGYCLRVEGTLLMSSEIDVYSERLEGGRRAIAVGESDYPRLHKDLSKMQDVMWKKFGTGNTYKNEYLAATEFNKWGMALEGKQKAQFIKEWIDNCELILKKNKAAREELRKIGRHIHSIYNENVVNKIKIEKVYVINDDPFAKFGPDFQKVKKMFSNIDVLELTSVQMGNLIRKGT